MAETPISALVDATKRVDSLNASLGKTESFLKRISNLAKTAGGSFATGFSTGVTQSSLMQGSSMGLGSSNASFGTGAMPWMYTRSGATAFGSAQAAVGVAGAAYSMMPDLGTALSTRSAYYQGAILSPGMTASGLAQRTLGALGKGVTSPTDAAAAQAMLSQGYNFNPGGASYLRAMQDVGGAARMMGISNPQAAQAMGALHTGDMSSRLYQAGISTIDTKTGTIRSTEDIYRQLYNRYFGGKGKITTQDLEISLREGFAGKELRSVLGFNDTQMSMFQKAAVQFSQGKGFNLPDATGKGNPAMDIYRQQTSLATTTESKADQLLSGLTTATDAYVRMNETIQGNNGVLDALAKFKGLLQGFGTTNAVGAIGSLVSGAAGIASTALAYKGMKAFTGGAGGSTSAVENAAKVVMYDAQGAPLITASRAMAATAGAGGAMAKVGTAAGRTVLGKALPILGGVISGATNQGFVSTVATSALAAGVIGGVSTGGVFAVPAALAAGALTAVGWGAAKAFHSMFATSKTSSSGGGSGGGNMSREQFATAVLTRIGAKPTEENMKAMLTWMQREQGHWGNTATYNPLNTTLTRYDSVNYKTGKKGRGVQAYTSWEEGIQATADTIQGSNFGGIYASLMAGNSAVNTLTEAQNSKWAVGNYNFNLASSPLVQPGSSASTTVSSGGHTVNINLRIDKASDAEAIALAKKVKELLLKDKTLSNIGSK